MTLKKITKKFLKDLDIDVKYAKEERDGEDGFYAYYWKNLIIIPRNEENYYSEEFMEDFNNRFPNVKAHEVTISILHEVGHCMVHPNAKCDTEEPANYFDRFDERVATAWAAEYIITHPQKIAKFEKKLAKLLEKG